MALWGDRTQRLLHQIGPCQRAAPKEAARWLVLSGFRLGSDADCHGGGRLHHLIRVGRGHRVRAGGTLAPADSVSVPLALVGAPPTVYCPETLVPKPDTVKPLARWHWSRCWWHPGCPGCLRWWRCRS